MFRALPGESLGKDDNFMRFTILMQRRHAAFLLKIYFRHGLEQRVCRLREMVWMTLLATT